MEKNFFRSGVASKAYAVVKRPVPVPVNPNRAATTAHARHASPGRAGTGLMLDGPRQRCGLGQPFCPSIIQGLLAV
jgi:hypothetical protein